MLLAKNSGTRVATMCTYGVSVSAAARSNARACGERAQRLGGSSGCISFTGELQMSQPRAREYLFSMSRATRPSGVRKSLGEKEAPFSAIMMGQPGPSWGVSEGWGTAGSWVFSQKFGPRLAAGLRVSMLKERQPLRALGFKTKTNLSNMCGHASFVILALAYLETDVLMLRGYAASGIGLSVLFQFYRAQPLWIPIGWNGLFMLINVSMIGLLLKERNDAGKLGDDPEQAMIYGEVFEKVDLSPVDFLRLVDLGERREVAEGELLSEEGRMQEDVFLVVDGTAEVDSEGVAVGELETQQFIGSMAFQQFISNSSPNASSANSNSASSSSSSPISSHSSNVSSSSKLMPLQRESARRPQSSANDKGLPLAESHQKMPPHAETFFHLSSRSTRGNLSSRTGSSSAAAKEDMHTSSEAKNSHSSTHQLEEGPLEDDDDLDDILDTDNYIPGGGGVFEEARKAGEAALGLLRQDSVVGVVAKSLAAARTGSGARSFAQLEPSTTTVTATTDMVVYAWNMHLLKAFIKRHPEAGVALQTAMSADLGRKIEASRAHEERYRIWLQEALAGGKVTPIEKQKLERYRTAHGISLGEHKAFLRQFDWKEEEFEAGFQKGVAPRNGSKDFLKYEALVQKELAKGEVREESRQHLRQFRAQAGIDAQEHLLVLEKQGWTADDYEVGGKGKAAELGGSVQSGRREDLREQAQGQEKERERGTQQPSLPHVQIASMQLRPTPQQQQQHVREEIQRHVTSRITLPRSVSNY